MVFPVRKCEFLSTPHAHIRVGPLGWRIRIKHATRNLLPRRELEALVLQRAVALGDIRQRVSALRTARPRLDEVENLVLDVVVHRLHTIARLEQAGQVVHKLAAGDLLHEVAASILDARVGQVERGQLDVGVLVAYAPLEAAHGFLRLHRLAADGVGDLEVERDVF